MIAEAEQPDRSLTFLFTDVEDSTGHWQRLPELTRRAVEEHDVILRQAILQENGYIFRTAGDAFYASFPDATAAIRAAFLAQQTLLRHFSPAHSPLPLRVRMALNTGPVQERDGDYFGLAPAGAARLLELACGGQILLTAATAAATGELPEGVMLQPIGERLLRSFVEPVPLLQVAHPTIPTGFPPPRTVQIPNNLPRSLTPFIGRERELGEIRHHVITSPLVTLIGAGGCGKTRLSLQACDYLFGSFRDGIYFLDLARISDGTLLPQTIADTLKIRPPASGSLFDAILDDLQDKRLLLVWDNCEHLIYPVADLAEALLRRLPHLHILATSREPLHTPGEILFAIHPLAVPESDTPQDLSHLLQYESVRLFVDRVTATSASFRLTAANASAIAGICKRLDGIPLALVIVAAWANALTPQQIEQRIQDRFRLLKATGPRASLPHHQTLRAAIDWSYVMLSESQQALLRRVSLFAGGFTLEAAEAVCAGPPIDDVIETLIALVQKSLVLFEETERGGRYRLLDTIRQYALDHLETSQELQTVAERHRLYFLAWIQETAPQFFGTDAAVALARTDAEIDNLRAALGATVDRSSGLRFFTSLFWFWHVRGSIGESRRWTEQFVDAVGDVPAEDKPLLAKAFNGAGILAWDSNDLAAAEGYFLKSLALQRELGNIESVAGCLSNLGSIAGKREDWLASTRYLEESLTHFEASGNTARQAMVLSNIGTNAERQNNITTAATYYERALALQRPLGKTTSLATNLYNLGSVHTKLGIFEPAHRYFSESYSLHLELNHRVGLAGLLDNLPLLFLGERRWQEAALLLGAADTYRSQLGLARDPITAQEMARVRNAVQESIGIYATEEQERLGSTSDLAAVVTAALKQGEEQ